MSWYILFAASIFEIGWAIGLKYTEGFTRAIPTILTLAAMGISVYLLNMAMRHIPVGTAYAVWTGVGAAGTAMLGMIIFGEVVSLARIFCLALIVGGVLGLKLSS